MSYGATLQLERISARNDRPASDLHITVAMNLEMELIVLFGIGNFEILFGYYESMYPYRPLSPVVY
jgi:hypothetical protein